MGGARTRNTSTVRLLSEEMNVMNADEPSASGAHARAAATFESTRIVRYASSSSAAGPPARGSFIFIAGAVAGGAATAAADADGAELATGESATGAATASVMSTSADWRRGVESERG